MAHLRIAGRLAPCVAALLLPALAWGQPANPAANQHGPFDTGAGADAASSTPGSAVTVRLAPGSIGTTSSNPAFVTVTNPSSGGSSSPSGTAGTAATGSGQSVPVFDAATGQGLLTPRSAALAPYASAPTGGSPAITTTATALIPANAAPRSIFYQMQGAGWACGSWVTTAVTITVSGSVATCGGAGAFLLQPGSPSPYSSPAALPNTPFTVIGAAASGGTLAANLAWMEQ